MHYARWYKNSTNLTAIFLRPPYLWLNTERNLNKMNQKKELQLAYGLAIILLFVGVICYTAFSAKIPEEPLRIMYKGAAGKVLFDHKTHAQESGYGIICSDCHHHPEDDESSAKDCNACHIKSDKKMPLPDLCIDCHDSDEIADVEMKNHTDSLHEQCIGCHEKSEQGPSDCSKCHAM